MVDDDAAVRGVTSAMLERLAYEGVAVESGTAALAACSSTRFDAVMLDLAMPEMSGTQVHERLREHHPALPILIVSGFAGPAADQHILSDPHTTLLAKPFSITELDAALTAVRKFA